jgi:hypothetical protein
MIRLRRSSVTAPLDLFISDILLSLLHGEWVIMPVL